MSMMREQTLNGPIAPARPATQSESRGIADAPAAARPAHVLGLSFFFHDSAAAIVSNGQVIAAASEERFCRRKHTNEFPKQAIEYCLEAAQLRSMNDVDAIVFYEKPILKLNRLLETLVDVWPRGLKIFAKGLPGFLTNKFNIYSAIQKTLPTYQGQILFAEHHLSHAASAFYCSPYDEAAILTIDGVGEWETTAVGVGRGSDIRLERAIRFPHSVGLLYSALTSYLGFQVNDGEWKVMGLAPYGVPKYEEQFRRLVNIKPDGSFSLNMEYFAHHYSSEWTADNERWEALFGFPRRESKAEIEQHHEDLARSGQAVVEDIILNLAREARRLSGSDNLVIAGGVGLNSVANWKIESQGIFKNVWIQPAAGDDGGALGAALLASQLLFETPRCAEMTDAYLGPEFSERAILDVLKGAALPYERLDDDALVERAASLIADGKVIGWFRGRMEFGPRALGSRSILADATNPGMKAIINKKIKYREYFRPFAPAVPLEDAHRYFDVPAGTPLPFMLKVPKVRPEAVPQIPAVTHEDGSGRVQTVTPDGNPLYYKLLKAVERRTGVPIIVNTSFNVRGEPIVCSPEDAIDCFFKTGIDALVLGNCLLTEKPGPELDMADGYARSDALEARISKGHQSAVAVVEGGRDSAGVAIMTGPAATMMHVFDVSHPPDANLYENAVDLALELRRTNRIKKYSGAARLLDGASDASVIDLHAGTGWFGLTAANRYGARATIIEPDPVLLKRARSLARMLSSEDSVEFVDSETYSPLEPVTLVSALDGLRHAPDLGALPAVAGWLRPGGYLQLCVYHEGARQPVVEHFDRLRQAGATDADLYEAFRRLNADIADQSRLRAWFRDQVLDVRGAAYSLASLARELEAVGCVIEAVGLDRHGRTASAEQLPALERRLAQAAREALRKQKYDPGAVVVWARRR
jgi:carbamoyltransferase